MTTKVMLTYKSHGKMKLQTTLNTPQKKRRVVKFKSK